MNTWTSLPNDLEWLKQKELLQDQIARRRSHLRSDLQTGVDEALNSMPEELVRMRLDSFLVLIELFSEKAQEPCLQFEMKSTARKLKQTMMGLDINDVNRLTLNFYNDSDRRITRSMAAKLRQQSVLTNGQNNDYQTSVLATPKLFKGLPETPAVIRQQIKEQRNIVSRPIRIAGSTIRATNKSENAPQNNVIQPKPSCKSGVNKKVPPANSQIANLIHMELPDGKILDVDLTKSPGAIFDNMPKDKTREVKEWLSQYATTFTSFLKRLGA